MNIEQLFPKKWLAPDDLAGHTVTVAIAAITLEKVRNPRTNREQDKLALTFHGKQKRLLINQTQAFAIAGITGSKETDTWPGHLITLSVTVAHNGAKTFAITAPPDPPAQAPKPMGNGATNGTANGATALAPTPMGNGATNGAIAQPAYTATPTANADDDDDADADDDPDPGASIFGDDDTNDTAYTGRPT